MFSALAATFLLSVSAASAQDCDASALAKAINLESAHGVAASFIALTGCDSDAARAAAPRAFERMLYGEDAESAVMAAIELGSEEIARGWISNLFSDERSRLLKGMGRQCEGNPAIVRFLMESSEALGDRFWDDRWHRALIPCRDHAVTVLLTQALQDRTVQNDPTRFDSILEVFIEHAGAHAIPWLVALMPAVRESNQVSVVQGFGTALNVGGEVKPHLARAASAAIQELAPELSPPAIYRARKLLESLGDQRAADGLVCMRYWDRLHTPGYLMWGAVVLEVAECKNGKTRIEAHHVQVQDRCKRWPDQIHPAVQQTFGMDWTGQLAARCKGTSTLEHLVPEEPFVDQAAYEAWRDATLLQVQERPAQQIEVLARGSADLP